MHCICRLHALGDFLGTFAPELGGASSSRGISLASEPDDAVARACLDHLGRVSSPVMVRHCRRTYQFGMGLAARAGMRPDAEVLYPACLLHDLGLEEAHDGPGDFETNGARAASEILARSGGEAVPERVAEAIELHTTLASADDPRPGAALLHMGAVMDVTGARLDRLSPALVGRIVEEFPREGTKPLIAALLGRQIRDKPSSRIERLAKRVDLLGLVTAEPFDG